MEMVVVVVIVCGKCVCVCVLDAGVSGIWLGGEVNVEELDRVGGEEEKMGRDGQEGYEGR